LIVDFIAMEVWTSKIYYWKSDPSWSFKTSGFAPDSLPIDTTTLSQIMGIKPLLTIWGDIEEHVDLDLDNLP
jgi:hypothetical protein